MIGDKYTIDGVGELAGSYSTRYPHVVIWRFHLDDGPDEDEEDDDTFTFSVLSNVFVSSGPHPLLADKGRGLTRLRFDYGGADPDPLPEAAFFFEDILVQTDS